MYARKYFLNYAEDIFHCFKFKNSVFCVGKCPGNKSCVRWTYVSSFLPENLRVKKKYVGFRLARCVEMPKMNRLTDDVYDEVDMDISGTSSSDDDVATDPCLYSMRRALEYTSHGLNLQQKGRLKNLDSEMFSVVSFNVLSQTLLERHMYLYRNCKSRDLKWAHRSARLLKDFKYLSPDVFCLQEVEHEHLDSFYKKELGRLGYVGVYKKRTHDKVDGCAIFYKSDKFDLVEEKTVELYRDRVRLLDRDNIGLIVKLSLKSRPAQQIVIATTHLLYTPRRTDIRLSQTQVMLAEMERFAYNMQGSYCPIVYTGDMNYVPHSAAYDLVERGEVCYETLNLTHPSYTSDKKLLLPRSVHVTDSCQFDTALRERREKSEESDGRDMYGSGSLSHQLNFSSVYSHYKNGGADEEATTYQDRWQTVDYIFYRRNSHKQLKLVSKLGLPSSHEAEAHLRHLPNSICGSDHLPLKATFHLRS